MYYLSIIAGEVALSLATTTTDQATAYLSLGVSHYRLGENEKAIEFLTTGSQLETPDDLYTPDIYVWLGIVYQANNEKDLSCDAFQKALELGEKKNYTWAINNAKSGLEGCPSQ
jgi:tetratricopeptide (TPR) repeat protein